ncbi:MAG TPA: HlyD family efflux transporter periplasmic adaptor subunit [Moheibacter sp.]|nr:HlyD family efflux transporter periplasmic adaptor subunit [Moheibacter sp.]
MPQSLRDTELRSESVQEILSNPPSWIIRWGITIVFIALLFAIAISIFVKYPDFIASQVVITTQNPPEKIEARSSGKMEAVFVQNQEDVKKGQVLAYLETSANYRDVMSLKSILDTFQVNSEAFKFPIETTRHLVLGEIETNYIQFEKAYTDYVLQKQLQPYSIEKVAGHQTISEINSRLKSLESQKKIEASKLTVEKSNYERNQRLFEQGVISASELETKRLQYLQAQQSFENIDVSISQLYESKVNAHRGLQGADISQKQDETTFYVNVLQTYDQLKRALRDWEQMYLLKSSIDGKVSFQQYWGENQFVKPGEIIFTVLPDDKSNLLGKLVVPAQNSGKILPGQKVLIKLDNYLFQQFGIVEGKVRNISLSPDAEGNYYVEVELPNGLKTSYNKNLNFDKEMRGSAEIVTEDLRLIERVFYQFRELFQFQ